SFVSPLCALSSALFTARTVHHLLLMGVAAPLIAWALPKARLPLLVVTLLQAVVLWAWHAPTAYGAALSNDAFYWLMQISLLASAVAFWSAVRGAEILPATGAVLATLVHTGLLGAVLTFAPEPVYAPHALTTLAWGLGWLEDQQLAGLIMWAPGAGLYLIAALAIAGRRIGWRERPA
ncbi:MAG: cytochrome c oxidase assembly protein, partial [Brevundimonas sp.]